MCPNNINDRQRIQGIRRISTILLFSLLCACSKKVNLEEVWRIPLDGNANLDVRFHGDSLLIKSQQSLTMVDLSESTIIFDQPGFKGYRTQTPFGLALEDALEFRGSSIWVIANELSADSLPRGIRINIPSKDRKHYSLLSNPSFLVPSKRARLLFFMTDKHLGLYEDHADTIVWNNQEVGFQSIPVLLEHDQEVIACDYVNNTASFFNMRTGKLIRQVKLPFKEFGLPFGGMHPGIGNELVISQSRELIAVSSTTGQKRWELRHQHIVHRVLPLPMERFFVLQENSEAQVVELSDGSIVATADRYACISSHISDPAIHPQNGRIALLSHCSDHLGVVVLDPETLEELYFIPGPSQENIGPILWGDLLIHFPAGENVVRAVRLPA
jgi:hypothetical protein